MKTAIITSILVTLSLSLLNCGCSPKAQQAIGSPTSASDLAGSSPGYSNGSSPGNSTGTSMGVAPNAMSEGGMDSGGEDNVSIFTGAAWFLTNHKTKVCFEIAQEFGVTQAQAQTAFVSAVKTWNDYIAEKHVFLPKDFQQGLTPTSNFIFDTCSDITELKVYLGVSDSVVEQAKHRFENPTAFVYRQAYDAEAGVSKGFMWVSPPKGVYPRANFPNWELPYRLQGIFLHELGHIYGVGHVPGTIMNASITNWLQLGTESEIRAKAVLTQIDDLTELYLCLSCEFSYSGYLSHGGNWGDVAEMFERLIGRLPVGNIKADFVFHDGKYYLQVSDEKSLNTVAVKPRSKGNSFGMATDLFKVIRKTSPSITGGFSRGQMGSYFIGEIDLNGVKRTVVIERNFNSSSALTIAFVDNGYEIVFGAALNGIDYVTEHPKESK